MDGAVFDKPTWAIVELMGRQVIAGEISEVTVAGAAMLRVAQDADLRGPGADADVEYAGG